MKDISKKIKKLREQAGMNSKELAEKSGLSPAYISKLEKGDYETISLKTSKQLSKGLGLTLKQLLEGLGLLKNGEKRKPNKEDIKQKFRSNGYTKEQAEQIMQYAEYIKQKNKK